MAETDKATPQVTHHGWGTTAAEVRGPLTITNHHSASFEHYNHDITSLQRLHNANNLPQRHVITHAQSMAVLSAAIAKASEMGVPQNIAVVDPSG